MSIMPSTAYTECSNPTPKSYTKSSSTMLVTQDGHGGSGDERGETAGGMEGSKNHVTCSPHTPASYTLTSRD
ncbi:hypothetical protein Bpfe_026098 [Biomphalaria pfeifferi]|uniref:Uncharacterized protein n=1 Tax=Biomphalaria pfeifferi TaxID=112525 RepID=A0AAD8EXW3_BIOPF|nr:hypothetical protein Bpfe_026098 [Biomphalaria pfeifferi]